MTASQQEAVESLDRALRCVTAEGVYRQTEIVLDVETAMTLRSIIDDLSGADEELVMAQLELERMRAA